MAKFLKVSFPENCIGCEICIAETQRQLNKVGLEGALIRVFREKSRNSEKLTYSIQLDPRVNELDIQKIKEICPTQVFKVVNLEDGDGLTR